MLDCVIYFLWLCYTFYLVVYIFSFVGYMFCLVKLYILFGCVICFVLSC